MSKNGIWYGQTSVRTCSSVFWTGTSYPTNNGQVLKKNPKPTTNYRVWTKTPDPTSANRFFEKVAVPKPYRPRLFGPGFFKKATDPTLTHWVL
jgi:hypothetical protein